MKPIYRSLSFSNEKKEKIEYNVSSLSKKFSFNSFPSCCNSNEFSLFKLPKEKKKIVSAIYLGYATMIFCRTGLDVAIPFILHDKSTKFSPANLGDLLAYCGACYFIGKAFSGYVVDLLGARWTFVNITTFGVCILTLIFATAASANSITFIWCLGAIAQSTGWPALTGLISIYFHPSQYGTVLSILSTSSKLGDIASKLLLGRLASYKVGWRHLFLISASLLGIVGFFNRFNIPEKTMEALQKKYTKVASAFDNDLENSMDHTTKYDNCGTTEDNIEDLIHKHNVSVDRYRTSAIILEERIGRNRSPVEKDSTLLQRNISYESMENVKNNSKGALSSIIQENKYHITDMDGSDKTYHDGTNGKKIVKCDRPRSKPKDYREGYLVEEASTASAICMTLTNPRFYFLTLCVACLNTIMEMDKYTPLYLHVALGYDRAEAAQRAAIYPLSQLIAMLLAALYFDNLSKRAKHFMFLGLTMLCLVFNSSMLMIDYYCNGMLVMGKEMVTKSMTNYDDTTQTAPKGGNYVAYPNLNRPPSIEAEIDGPAYLEKAKEVSPIEANSRGRVRRRDMVMQENSAADVTAGILSTNARPDVVHVPWGDSASEGPAATKIFYDGDERSLSDEQFYSKIQTTSNSSLPDGGAIMKYKAKSSVLEDIQTVAENSLFRGDREIPFDMDDNSATKIAQVEGKNQSEENLLTKYIGEEKDQIKEGQNKILSGASETKDQETLKNTRMRSELNTGKEVPKFQNYLQKEEWFDIYSPEKVMKFRRLQLPLMFMASLSFAVPFYLPPSLFALETGGSKHCGVVLGLIHATSGISTMIFHSYIGSMSNTEVWPTIVASCLTFSSLCAVIFMSLYVYFSIPGPSCSYLPDSMSPDSNRKRRDSNSPNV